jgi:hypothetical protein
MSSSAARFLTGSLRARDLDDLEGPFVYTITAAGPKQLQDGKTKLSVSFEETGKSMILGTAANLRWFINELGDDFRKWTGEQVELYVIDTEHMGKPCRGIRVRKPDAKTLKAVAAKAKKESAPTEE